MRRALVPLLLASACSAAPPPPPPAHVPAPSASAKAPAAAPAPAPRLPHVELSGLDAKTVLTAYGPDGDELYEVPIGWALAVVGAPDGGAYAVVMEREPKNPYTPYVLRIDGSGRETFRTSLQKGGFTWRLFRSAPAGTAPKPEGDRLFVFEFSGPNPQGKRRMHVLDAASGKPLREVFLAFSDIDARGGVMAVSDGSKVSRIGPDGEPVWSVHVSRFPSLDPSLPEGPRKVAVGTDGTVLTGTSDGSLVALDAEGKPLYQLGVRGSVSRIDARAGGAFLVDTDDGPVLVDHGTVRETAESRPVEGVRVVDKRKGKWTEESPTTPAVPWKPTIAHRVQREGLSPEKPFQHVQSVVAAAPNDVWVLGKREQAPGEDADRLFHYDGRTWSDLGVPSMSFPKEVFAEGVPARVSRFVPLNLSRSPSGALLVLGVRVGGAVRPCVLERAGSAYRERRELRAAFSKVEIEYGTKLSHTASAGGREVLCSSDPAVCVEFGRGVTPKILPDGEGPEIPDLLGDHESPVPLKSTWASGRDDVWATGITGGVARFDGQRWWRILGIEPVSGLSVTGSGRGDVWIYGDAGLWHVTPEPRAEADLEGTTSPPPPPAAPSAALSIVGADASYRLERVVLDVDGQKPLRAALHVAEGPGGVVWLHDGARVVEYDGAHARLLYQLPKPEPFFCWYAPEPDCNLCAQCTERKPKSLSCQRCAAPTAAGEGALLAPEGWLPVRGGRATPEPAPLSDLLSVTVAPSGAIWAVSAAGDDTPHAVIHGPRGVRLVTGLPPAAYADLAVRADDDAWFAGGLTGASTSDGRVLPEGEGTLVRFDGRTFTRHRAPDGALLSVAAAGPGEAWAVGLAGAVLHAKGTTVEAFHLERDGGKRLPVILRSVAATGPNDVWIVGDGSTLLRWDGKALRRVDASQAGNEAAFSAVIAPGAKPGWVVGPGGIFRIVPVR
ncbi:PQQ-binding-like beta-propeller repeat protein [Polyangium sp. y55x31]|uniref:PQQ-binding-like beta-propeller repeat protein n=1 Tax=Polyangium sp. y55x31 TaxID=3042688 RepID=UPI002482CC2D|nr:PQQ-binding-like beta-propeller repeat protein [Polyangium sp. y55x31]MDI1480271.1 PQQ-binding-like beta-propeller repeat protein [Polyangium sp. y55x31]